MSIDEIAQNSIPHDFHGFLASTLEDIEKKPQKWLANFCQKTASPCIYIYICIHYTYVLNFDIADADRDTDKQLYLSIAFSSLSSLTLEYSCSWPSLLRNSSTSALLLTNSLQQEYNEKKERATNRDTDEQKIPAAGSAYSTTNK